MFSCSFATVFFFCLFLLVISKSFDQFEDNLFLSFLNVLKKKQKRVKSMQLTFLLNYLQQLNQQGPPKMFRFEMTFFGQLVR
jgi:hypothetical protein